MPSIVSSIIATILSSIVIAIVSRSLHLQRGRLILCLGACCVLAAILIPLPAEGSPMWVVLAGLFWGCVIVAVAVLSLPLLSLWLGFSTHRPETQDSQNPNDPDQPLVP